MILCHLKDNKWHNKKERSCNDAKASQVYGKVRTNLQRAGHVIGPLDMLIAAHAISSGLILVTNNTKEFTRIKELQVENWAAC